jgi:VanZ family protein
MIFPEGSGKALDSEGPVPFGWNQVDCGSMTKFLRGLLFVGCLAIVLFFALKPDPEVPEAVGTARMREFFNSFDALRNQLGFGLLGVASLLLLMGRSILNRRQILAVSLIALLIPALEIAQVWMPQRHVDLDDVLNGWLGLGVACFLYLAVRWLWQIATRGRSKTGLATRRGEH